MSIKHAILTCDDCGALWDGFIDDLTDPLDPNEFLHSIVDGDRCIDCRSDNVEVFEVD